MAETLFHGRRAVQIENADIRVTVLVEGGHIAELLDKTTGVNPLWTPVWPTIEPSTFDPTRHGDLYGTHGESRLLSGIMGHNLCVDIFGGPSEEEAAAGLTPHGEGSIVLYQIDSTGNQLVQTATFPMAGLAFERRMQLDRHVAVIRESLTNLGAIDKPIAWTHHVTLGAPFVVPGKTRFAIPGTRSRVYEGDFGEDSPYQPGADFDWPHVPLKDGGTLDLRLYPQAEASSGYTAHLLDPDQEEGFFTAYSPDHGVLCGYNWNRSDYPWIGIWEENRSRKQIPWCGQTITRGMEFGVSPMPESRRQMIERGSLFGVPGYRWIPARGTIHTDYIAFVKPVHEGMDDAAMIRYEDYL
jgi:hypothetical protein